LKLIFNRFSALFVAVFLFISIPHNFIMAYPLFSASIFNIGLNNLNSNQTKEVAIFKENSQNVAILSPANHIDPNPAKGGGDINIVDNTVIVVENSPVGLTGEFLPNSNNGRINVYEVREGDTLSQIANMYNVSINTIRWANDFSGDIQPGQSLIILPVTGVRHVVKNGGTIADVAEIYHADPREIALFNGLPENTTLKKGDEIIVPNADMIHGDEEKSKPQTNSKTYAKNSSNNSKTTVSSFAGYYSNPLPGAILTQGLHGYNAVDLGAPLGTPIYAAAAGTVITSKQGGWNGGYGSMIVISHDNGTQTLYSHQSENVVYVGQKVKKGQLIGYVGSTGRSTGNHLHFEIRGAKNPIASACVVGKVCKY
jgi:murein DD-endopeptidase MepM/ murein hydrolase activator NlpD